VEWQKIKLEKQKGMQKSIFPSNSAAPLWPGSRRKILAECPFLMQCQPVQRMTAHYYCHLLFWL